MPRTRIKVCGLRTLDAARAAADAGADAVGFVFVRASVRHIAPADAWAIVGHLPPMVASVAVFMNPSLQTYCDAEEICPTALSQFHGDEPESLVRQCGPGVIKGLRYDPATIRADLECWSAVEEVDAILIDGSAGGGGESFDWAGLADAAADLARPPKPLILAGGLTPANVADAIRAVRPFAVDVSSGVERERGVKDASLIAAFCRAVHDADRG